VIVNVVEFTTKLGTRTIEYEMLLVAFKISTNTVMVRFGSTFPHQSIDRNVITCEPCAGMENGAFAIQFPRRSHS